MEALFDDMQEVPQIDGLHYIPDFISGNDEAKLLQTIDAQIWRADLRRRVQHYGYVYDYKTRNISRDLWLGALPGWLSELTNKLVTEKYFKRAPDQVIINEYEAGQGIAPHIDCVPCFGDTIASLSIGSPIDMNFQNPKTGVKASLRLASKSLLIFSGSARQQWQHGIASRKSDIVNGTRIPRTRRVSLTFRNVIISK